MRNTLYQKCPKLENGTYKETLNFRQLKNYLDKYDKRYKLNCKLKPKNQLLKNFNSKKLIKIRQLQNNSSKLGIDQSKLFYLITWC